MTRGRLFRNAAMTGLFSVAGWVAIVFIFLIFLFTFKETIPIFTDPEVRKEANLQKFFGEPQEGPTMMDRYVWQPTSEEPKVSLWPIILGTLKATIVGMLFACPIGVAAAVFSSEFAPPRLREVIKPVIELLAGIPSVVMGFFALIVLATWLQDAFGFTYRLNAINAGLALGFALVPIVYTISEDGLSAVPRSYREASYALGATRFQTAIAVVLPAAAPAVFASFVLAFGRAIGETMILLMAGGNAAITSFSLLDPLRTLSATIAAEMGEVVVGSAHYSSLFFMGTLLFVITFVSNSFGQWVIHGMQRRMQGVGIMTTIPAPQVVFKGNRGVIDKVAITLLGSSVVLIVTILVVIVANIVIHGVGAVTWEFISQPPRQGLTAGGIMPAIVGTAALVILMSIVAVPLGVATAVYLHEYTPAEGLNLAWRRFRVSKGMRGRRKLFFRAMSALLATVTRSAVANLAGVPSIVFGLFGLGFFIQFIGRNIDRVTQPPGEVLWGQGSLLWAACTLALLTLPTVIVATEEALRTVPQDLREASLALGATQWETIRRVVLPSSLSGIMTGAILGISRGAGEVAPILFTGAAYYLPYLPGDVTDQFMHLGYHVLILSTQSPDVEATKPLLYGTVFVLLALTFLLNLTGVIIRSRTRSRLNR